MLTQSRLKELLSYDSGAGIFTWLVATNNRVKVGAVAGSGCKDGYVSIMIDGRRYKAHRLAWLFVHGHFPPAEMDHINRVKADNRIGNLRPATGSDNQKNISMLANNTSGYKGICWHKREGKWRARANLNRRCHSLGYYTTAEAASEAYQAFARQHHGEFFHDTTRQAALLKYGDG